MRIVVDSSVFWRKEALARLGQEDADIIVPAVAFTERARHLNHPGVGPADFLRDLDSNDMEVEAYGVDQAVRFAIPLPADRQWRRLARDAVIAGHLGREDVLWTANPKDFRALGVPAGQVRDVATLRAS